MNDCGDARGTPGIARSGLLIRATSATTTTGSVFDPRSISTNTATTWTRGSHTLKFGGEYRRLQSDFQFLGSTEITYNSINDFIDNIPNAVAVALDSPVFGPQQYYLVGYMQDSWRAHDRLTFELGLRYDFYSPVKEKNSNAKPFFIEENNFGADPDNFYNADKNNFSPRLSAVYRIDDRTVLFANDDVRISWFAAIADRDLYRDATGDQLVYVQSGRGVQESAVRDRAGARAADGQRLVQGRGDYRQAVESA